MLMHSCMTWVSRCSYTSVSSLVSATTHNRYSFVCYLYRLPVHLLSALLTCLLPLRWTDRFPCSHSAIFDGRSVAATLPPFPLSPSLLSTRIVVICIRDDGGWVDDAELPDSLHQQPQPSQTKKHGRSFRMTKHSRPSQPTADLPLVIIILSQLIARAETTLIRSRKRMRMRRRSRRRKRRIGCLILLESIGDRLPRSIKLFEKMPCVIKAVLRGSSSESNNMATVLVHSLKANTSLRSDDGLLKSFCPFQS